MLNLNTQYTAVIKWDFVAGSNNDVATLYINPTAPIITNNTPYSSVTWGVAEPATLAAVNLRIGGSTTTPAVNINSIEVAVIPEPSTYALLALAAAGVAGYAARRRSR